MKNILVICLLTLFSSLSFGQDSEEKRIAHYNVKKNLAIQGYDPVAYFIKTAAKGNPLNMYRYKGLVYLFLTEENKKEFIKNPAKYEPVYGGWCAYAMGLEKADKVAINPKTFKIIDNKLYLFYNKLGINTLEKWNKEGQEKLKNNADKNWNNILSK